MSCDVGLQWRSILYRARARVGWWCGLWVLCRLSASVATIVLVDGEGRCWCGVLLSSNLGRGSVVGRRARHQRRTCPNPGRTCGHEERWGNGAMIPARPKLGWCFCFHSEILDDCVFEVRSSSTLDARWELRLCRRLRKRTSNSYESAFARSHLSI